MSAPRERVLTALSRKVPDRVPNGFEGFNRKAREMFRASTGTDDYCAYFKVDYRFVSADPVKAKFAWDTKAIYGKYYDDLPDSAGINGLGFALVPGEDGTYDHIVSPLTRAETPKEIEEYPLPPPVKHDDLFRESVEKTIRNGFAAVGAMACTIFETAWKIRGYNELLTDFSVNEKMAAVLLERLTEMRCSLARKFAVSGVDILLLGDDVGMQDRLMMAPETWRKWLKPCLRKVIKSCLDVKPDTFIFYHSDGYIEPIIPDLIEIGVNVLNPVQPECMDPARLKREYGDRLAFWGTVGTQTTLPFGTPDEIRKVVKERIETVGKGGGLVLAPTHDIEPDVPWENLLAYFEALEKYGAYNLRKG